MCQSHFVSGASGGTRNSTHAHTHAREKEKIEYSKDEQWINGSHFHKKCKYCQFLNIFAVKMVNNFNNPYFVQKCNISTRLASQSSLDCYTTKYLSPRPRFLPHSVDFLNDKFPGLAFRLGLARIRCELWKWHIKCEKNELPFMALRWAILQLTFTWYFAAFDQHHPTKRQIFTFPCTNSYIVLSLLYVSPTLE